MGSLGVRVTFRELDLPVGLAGFSIDPENLAEGSQKVDGVLLDGGHTTRAGIRRLALGRALVAPFFLPGAEIKADQHVLFLLYPIAEEDLAA